MRNTNVQTFLEMDQSVVLKQYKYTTIWVRDKQ